MKKKWVNVDVTVSLVAALGLMVLIGLSGCKSKEKIDPKPVRYTAKTAEVVSHVTTGRVSPGAEIVVRFVRAEIDEQEVGGEVNGNIFNFRPKIKGTAAWRDSRTLVFKPNKKLPFHTDYMGEIRINELFPRYNGLEPVQVRFGVSGRKVKALTGDFEAVRRKGRRQYKYKGEVEFTEPIELEKVKEALSFSNDSVGAQKRTQRIPLTVRMVKENLRYTFASGPVKRGTESSFYLLEIDKKKAGLSGPVKKELELPPLKALKVMACRKFDQGDRPGIEITFSDELDPGQDKTGLVRVERDKAVSASAPRSEVNIKTIGKKLFVEGNLTYGESFTIRIAGIRGKWGAKLQNEVVKTLDFEDKKPELAFMSSGVFLPSSNNRKLGFKSINVRRVQLEVKKVYESNLGQFLQTEKINSRRKRNFSFNHQYIHRVGIPVAFATLNIGENKNKWLSHQLDLKKLIKPGEKGLFLVRLTFGREDILYGKTENQRYYYGREYHTNPNSDGYYQRNGSIYKPVAVSDIGLIYKKGSGENRHIVFATDIVEAEPMENVKITLRTFQNQVIAVAETGKQGKAAFKNQKKGVFYIEAEKNGQRSFIQPNEMAWNISSFDTGGEEYRPGQIRAFIYTERGVYRPGETVNLSLVARNHQNTFPDHHPVTLKIYNPKNQVMFNRTKTDGKDGFYNFTFAGKPEDMTGNWKAEFCVGSRTFYHPLKIETVAPYRLKVNIKPDKKQLTAEDEKIKFSIQSRYLFGSPAASLKTDATLTYMHGLKTFSHFKDFLFNNESVKFLPIRIVVFDGTLDENGHVDIESEIPVMDAAPSGITAHITAKVFEKGGRPTRSDQNVSVDPYIHYVGLKKPRSWVPAGERFQIPAVLVDREGKPAAGKGLKYTIYKNSYYWWYEYDNVRDFRVRFKNDSYTRQVKEGTVVTKDVPVSVDFKPHEYGEYLIEVENDTPGGHRAGFFFSVYHYGELPGKADNDNAGALVLAADKAVYHPGDTARITFPKPNGGMVLVTVEKANEILKTWVYSADQLKEINARKNLNDAGGSTGENRKSLQVEIPVTGDMTPNVYVSAAVIQPHHQTANDRPLRMYGVIPLMVKDPVTEHRLEIIMPDTLKSEEDFEVEVRTADNKPTQLTVAVVDEGLLDITKYTTPNPWNHFFKKQRLSTGTYDLFSYVIGANKGDIFRLFSIGGDIDTGDTYRSSQLDGGKAKRFKPVSMFIGPIQTDENGRARVTFKMPNYIGSVRVMAVSATANRYGRAEKSVPVKTDLMILPKLPRVLAPGDSLKVPVSVFAMNESIKDVKVSVDIDGPVEIEGEKSVSLRFDQPGEKDVMFSLKVKQAVGSAAVTVKAAAPGITAYKKTDLNIRPSSPRIYDTAKYRFQPGEKLDVNIPDRGIPGSNRAVISVSRQQGLNLGHRLDWLIRYPYGCIEQTTSSVFPQLYLKWLLKKSRGDEKKIDKNINAGIRRLRRFQTPSGGFSYWPGGRTASVWGTNYGSHFLIEAKRLGYHVPENMMAGLIRFMKSRALTEQDNLMERTYRLYILAAAGEPQVGPMNLLKENKLTEMSNTEKWMLAGAYYRAGREIIAKNILQNTDTTVRKYREFGGTYGSGLRDKAVIMEVAAQMEDWNRADVLYENILEQISGNDWYSTQTLGYTLLAVGKYIRVNQLDNRTGKSVISGYIKLPGKDAVPFETDNLKFSVPVTEGFGKTAEVFLDSKSQVKRGFVQVEWNGVPLNPDVKDESNNLYMKVKWLDHRGEEIDPASIKQGTTFWGHFRVKLRDVGNVKVEELALVQVLPSGWEIENTRLLKEAEPRWSDGWNLNREEYLDIRDDRIMWFFDLADSYTAYDFLVKLNAVTVGEFTLPPALFEAMYNEKYKAVKAGGKVTVVNR